MNRSTRFLAAALAAGGLALSCDEGKLVTGPEGEPFEAQLEDVTGPDTLFAGQQATYSTTVRVGDDVVTADVLDWTTTPPTILVWDTTDHDSDVEVTGRAPGAVTLTAAIDDPNLAAQQTTTDVTVLLLGVAPVAPGTGDTTLTALDDAFTVRAHGMGQDGVAADSAGLAWTHKGSALDVVPPLTGRDTLRVQAIAVGTDTLIFRQEQDLCVQGKCVDTIFVRVQPVPARLEAAASLQLGTLGRSYTAPVTVYDANDNPIPNPAVVWTLVDPADTVHLAVAASGELTARTNGAAQVVATAGAVDDTVDVEVRQVIDRVTASPDLNLTAVGAVDTVALAAADSSGAAVTRPFDIAWTVRSSSVATLSTLPDGRAEITAAGAGSTFLVGEAESRRDSVRIDVGQTAVTVTVTPDSTAIGRIGSSEQLSAAVADANGNPIPGASVTWSSLDSNIATVSGSGVVTASAVGTTEVIATSGSAEGRAKVVVRQVPETVTVTPTGPAPLLGGDQVQLSAEATDSNGVAITGASFTWGSGDTGIATVNGTGLVTAQNVASEDTTWVTATSGPASDSARIVVQPPTLSSVDVVPNQATITALTATTQLVGRGLNQNASRIPGESFTWQSRDTNVATVAVNDDSTAVVTAEADGQTYVVATSVTDPSLTDSALVTVDQQPASVTISPSSHTFNALDDTRTFTATATDAQGQTVTGATFNWSAGLSGALSHLGGGQFRADAVHSSAEAIVSVAGFPGVTDTASVVIRQVPDSILVLPAVDTISVNGTLAMMDTVFDANGNPINGAGVTWTDLDDAIATVDAAGTVTGQSVGDSARIVAFPVDSPGTAVQDTAYITVAAYTLAFDGTDDYVDIGDNLDLNTTAWTVELWVKPTTVTGTQYLMAKGGAATNQAAYGVYLDGANPAVFIRQSAGGSITEFVTSATLTAGAWQHLAVSYDGAKIRVYVNGAPADSTASTNTPQDVNGMLILGDSDDGASNPFEGGLDELRFWNVVRTDAEIAAAYNAPLTGAEANLRAYWAFDAGAGSSATDAVGALVATFGTATGGDAAEPAWAAEDPSATLP